MTTPVLPSIEIEYRQGRLVLPCAPVGDHFAVVPAVAPAESGALVLTGFWRPVHVPTGNHVAPYGDMCLCCARKVAEGLAALPLDWATRRRGPLPESVASAAQEVVSLALKCPDGVCQLEEEMAVEGVAA